MKTLTLPAFVAITAAGFILGALSTLGESPSTTSLTRNGRLISGNLQPGSTASVEWASSVQGPWTNNWKGLESVLVDSSGAIDVNVPMFYRVRGIRPPALGNATFTKWVTGNPNQPGRVLDMAGVVGGDVGAGTFSGEVLLYSPGTPVSHFVAFYRFTGPQHSFAALVDVYQTGATNGSKAVVTGVVADGWLKGHAVAGEFTQVAIDHDGGAGYSGSLEILSDLAPPSPGKATFTKWVTANPNQPGRVLEMAGVVGGVAGTGTFSGEVLLYDPGIPVSHFVAFYRFSGPQHSFTALVDVHQTGATTGSKAVVTGVIVDGWMKGRAVEGEFTQIAIDHDGGTGYSGSLDLTTTPSSLGKATFTKWVTGNPNQPGRVLDMAGVVGGDVGAGTFSGEVLLYSPGTPVSHFVAFYRFTGPEHSFAALVDVYQTGATNGSKAVVTGVVADGWLKGHAVAGEFTQVAIDHDGGVGYSGSLEILSKSALPSGNATFRKWVTTFPNQPGLIAEMAGVVGGDPGAGTYAGEVLFDNVANGLETIAAFYRFTGPQHSFTALMAVEQIGAVVGSKGAINGVITDGWLKGRAVTGEYTQIECEHAGVSPFCYDGTVQIH